MDILNFMAQPPPAVLNMNDEITLAETRKLTRSMVYDDLETLIDNKVIITGKAKGVLDDSSIDIERN